MNIQSKQVDPSSKSSFFERSIEWYGKELILQSGRIAKQADASILASMGETLILTTAVISREPVEDQGFLPLSVSYREMFSAAGKIPGGFVKREGKLSDHEVLVSRLIDRSIRPLIEKGFRNEVQVISTVLSYDPSCDPVILAMIGASAAIAVSGAPIKELVAAARLGMIGDSLVVNPSAEQLKKSKLDLILSGGKADILMLEGSARELPESTITSCLHKGSEVIAPVIDIIQEFKDFIGKDFAYAKAESASDVDSILSSYKDDILEGFKIGSKIPRAEYFASLQSKAAQSAPDLKPEVFLNAVQSLARSSILETGKRFGGRGLAEIREISCEVGILPRVHGSSLFTRGDTQVFASVTLGTAEDEQIVDGIYGDVRESFLLHYMFPPYSTGECGAMRAPGRREIGHGRLALKAVHPLMPEKSKFPYTVRVVAEITESDGSSSQATICAATLALMDAGVPLRSMVSGIAMGLVKEGQKVAVLSDIAADEDYFGDMDFKVAGTEEGITALQMDSKIGGISIEILEATLLQAKEGRMHILSEMSKVIKAPRVDLSPHAPVVTVITISKSDIKSLIGPGGRVIKEICEKSSSKINVSDAGEVQIGAPNAERMKAAVDLVRKVIGEEVTVGSRFDGKVVNVIDSGVFVNYSGAKDGFVHISEITNTRVSDIGEYLQEGDRVPVMVIGFDKGRVRLSIKACEGHEPYLRKSGDSGQDFRGGEFRSRRGERTEFGSSDFRSRREPPGGMKRRPGGPSRGGGPRHR